MRRHAEGNANSERIDQRFHSREKHGSLPRELNPTCYVLGGRVDRLGLRGGNHTKKVWATSMAAGERALVAPDGEVFTKRAP
jgi:hypothetical protein